MIARRQMGSGISTMFRVYSTPAVGNKSSVPALTRPG
jgi:hypothetical protein